MGYFRTRGYAQATEMSRALPEFMAHRELLVYRITKLLSVSTLANHTLFDSLPLTPYKNLMPVLYTDARGGELLRVGLTSLTARGTVLIITLIGNGFGGHFVSKKLSGDFAFGNCL